MTETVVTSLSGALGFVTAFIMIMTQNIKPVIPNGLVFLIPLLLGIGAFVGLHYVFPAEIELPIAILNGVIYGLSSTAGYIAVKNDIKSEYAEETTSIDIQEKYEPETV